MSMVKRETSRHEMLPKGMDLFDRWFDDRLNFFRRPMLVWPDIGDSVRVEEFRDDGTLVIRAELAGIDPDNDVEVSVKDHVLHIEAKRQEEEKSEERDYTRREFRYGSFTRSLPLPTGVTETDVKATYKDGILEVRIPMPVTTEGMKVPVEKA